MNLLCSQTTQYFFNFSDTLSSMRSIALWVIIAYIVAFAITFAIVKDEGKRKLLKKIFLLVGGALTAAAIVGFGYAESSKNIKEGAFVAITFYPLLSVGIVIVLSAVALAFYPAKSVKITVACVLGAAMLAALACLCVYYFSGEASEFNYVDKSSVNSLALWGAAVLLSVGIIITAVVTDKRKSDFDSRSLTFGGVFIALSFALSYVRLLKMPMGGSITLASVLPIMLYSYMFGAKKGILIGVIYGVLQAIQDPWILHPAQFVLDYPIAFAGIGLAGIFAGKFKKPCAEFVAGGVLAALIRLLAHYLSGVFAFGSYAASYGIASPWVYSIAYNAAFVLPDAAVAVFAGFFLMLSRSFRNAMGVKIGADKKVSAE